MASISGSMTFQDSRHSHNHSADARSLHRKIPDRLPLKQSYHVKHDSLNTNGFLDHPEEDGTNGFVTPATSRFPSQDIGTTMADHSHHGDRHDHHDHTHYSTYVHSHDSPLFHTQTPAMATQAAHSILNPEYQGSMITAALVSLLIALPFVLSSLVQVSPFEIAEEEGDLQVGAFVNRKQRRYLSLLGVCSLTAATLVIVGAIGELQGSRRSKIAGKTSRSSRDRLLSFDSLTKISERILSIGLPFYAASRLGGERVAIVTLVSVAAELGTRKTTIVSSNFTDAWNLVKSRKWTFAALVLQCVSDLANLTTTSLPWQTLTGYLALAISVLLLPWPFPSGGTTFSRGIADKGSRRSSNVTSWDTFGTSLPLSPLISSARDTDLTVASGVIATVISFVVFVLSSQETQTLTIKLLLGGSVVAVASAISLLFADSRTILPSTTTVSLGFALGSSLFIQEAIDSHPLLPILFQFGHLVVSWVAICLDTKWLQSHDHIEKPPSWFSRMIIRQVEDHPLLFRIFSKKDSRRIIYFMTLNLSFMFVQGVYGSLTGSLGLISDTIHMFFDCAALFMGLVASLLSEKSASLQYPYGFGKMDALAGFGNGVLLLAISVEIVYEAVERITSGSQLNRLGELLVVSTGGLLVNIFGLVAFGHHHHGAGHSHGSCGEHGHEHDHSHSHAHSHEHKHEAGHDHHHEHGHDHKHENSHSHIHAHDSPFLHGGSLSSTAWPSPLPLPTPTTPAQIPHDTKPHSHHEHSHGHSHTHDHAHGSNMYGIYLHVLADMMGSVAVMVSTVLVHYTGWAGWDAVASAAIAYFIIMATVPLVKSTAKQLVLDIPENKEFDLREALSGVGQLRSVVNITAPRFWLSEEGTSGVMHVVAARGADLDDVRERALAFLKGKGMDVLVQVEREGEGRCWCGSTNTASNSKTS